MQNCQQPFVWWLLLLQGKYAKSPPPSWWPLDTFDTEFVHTRKGIDTVLAAMRKLYGVDGAEIIIPE